MIEIIKGVLIALKILKVEERIQALENRPTHAIAGRGKGTEGVTVQEEGVTLASGITTLNFVGTAATATVSGTTATITITGGAAVVDNYLTEDGSFLLLENGDNILIETST